MAINRAVVGKKAQLTILRVEAIDDDGNVIDVWFEVWDGNTKLNGHFSSYDDAIEFVEATLKTEQDPEPPSSGFSPGT